MEATLRGVLVGALVGLLGASCVVRAPEGEAMGEAGSEAAAAGLVGSLEVEVVQNTARLTLHVTNAGMAPVQLEFPSTQRYDFQVRTLAGETLWTWSADKSFAQMLVHEELAPGGTLRQSEPWPVTVPAGEYVAVGRLVTVPPLELSARFRVPAE